MLIHSNIIEMARLSVTSTYAFCRQVKFIFSGTTKVGKLIEWLPGNLLPTPSR